MWFCNVPNSPDQIHEQPAMKSPLLLLLDIGNTNTHLGLATARQIKRQIDIPTQSWFDGSAEKLVRRFLNAQEPSGAVYCSVAPKASVQAESFLQHRLQIAYLALTHKTVGSLGIDYPRPETIGPDRLANAIAATHLYGAPSVVVDFGTAVTFDVINGSGHYVGGIIAPGLAAMTTYLHEKTALLPAITIREVHSVIGKSTEEAMLIGAVHGYRGLIRELLSELRQELAISTLPVVATGGYARLIAAKMPEINAVAPNLTLHGLRLAWLAHTSINLEY
jgi:type III pantothenate kinase